MISLLIFSKDRTMQMDLLIQSIYKNCNMFDDILVLYNTSSVNFQLGYEKLAAKWPEVRFVQETDFQQNTHDLIAHCKNDLICILSDDCIFYRNVTDRKELIIHTMAERPEVFSFILGIGGDSRYSGTCGHYFTMPEFEELAGDILIYNWQTADVGEFRCPFMLAANIYRKNEYLECLSVVDYPNPSYLESNLQNYWQQDHPYPKAYCAVFKEQSLVHSLNNRVQDWFCNLHGQEFFYDANMLNHDFYHGKVVDLDALDFSEVNGLHKEIKFIFKES